MLARFAGHCGWLGFAAGVCFLGGFGVARVSPNLLHPISDATLQGVVQRALAKGSHSVTFTSAESSASVGFAVVNRVVFEQEGSYDVWLMEQNAGRVASFGIVVDTGAKPPAASYFELSGTLASNASKPKLVPLSVPCFSCHPSGPRVLRPSGEFDRASARPSEADFRKIASLNARIAAYGDVQTVFPDDDPLRARGQLALYGPRDWDVLPDPPSGEPCSTCHGAESGIRGPLLVQHHRTAAFLSSHGTRADGLTVRVGAGALRAAMPPPQSATDAPKVLAKDRNKRLSSGGLQIRVATTLGTFDVWGAAARVFGSCEVVGGSPTRREVVCTGRSLIDLSRLSTGVGMRDRHLDEQVVQRDGGRLATLEAQCRIPVAPGTTDTLGSPWQRDVSCEGFVRWLNRRVTIPLFATVRYQDGVISVNEVKADIKLSDFGLGPFRFFRIGVEDVVAIRWGGTLAVPALW